MNGYKIELSSEERKVFSILETLPNPYKVYRKLASVEKLHEIQYETIQVQQHDWQTPLGLVLKKGD